MIAAERTERIGLALEPLDALFFRDGRPFEAGSRGRSGLPNPQVLAGAVRTWLLRDAGCDFGRLGERLESGAGLAEAAAEQSTAVAVAAGVAVHGPWLTVDGRPVVPMPATVVEVVGEEGELARLDPLKEALPGWRPPEPGMLPLWRRDRRPGKRAEGFLTLDGLRVFLEGGVPKMGQVLRPDELYGFDYRTGIEFDGGARTAKKGGIYGVRLLVLKESVSLYAELMGPPEVLSSLSTGKDVLLPLGGEGRRVAVRRTVPVEWPSVRPATPGEGLLLLLTTPGLFGGWRPLGLGLIAAAVPGSDAVSGWDLARGAPKPNRFAVPAGSVYFVKEPPAGAGGSLCASEDAALGWGGFVEGRWKHV